MVHVDCGSGSGGDVLAALDVCHAVVILLAPTAASMPAAAFSGDASFTSPAVAVYGAHHLCVGGPLPPERARGSGTQGGRSVARRQRHC